MRTSCASGPRWSGSGLRAIAWKPFSVPVSAKAGICGESKCLQRWRD